MSAAKKKSKNRKKTQLLITSGVMAALVAAVLVVVLSLPADDPPAAKADPSAADKQAPANDPKGEITPSDPAENAPAGPTLVDDNGRTLWASPTTGEAMPLGWLPPGVQMVISVRLSDALQTTDGRIVAEQYAELLKPLADDLRRVSVRLKEIDRLTVGLRPGTSYGQIEATYVVQTDGAEVPTGKPVIMGGGKLGNLAKLSDGAYLIAGRAALDEIVELEGDAPPLRREMEELAEASDGTRHVTLLLAPSFLFADGKSLFAGEMAALEEPLFMELPKYLRGLLVSIHWEPDRFYWEVRAASAAEMTATKLSATFDQRLGNWPNELQMAILDLNPAPHGRRVVANLPAMSRLASEYARRGVIGRHAVLNGYLPPAAGHNLLLAADLMLAQQSAGVTGSGAGGSAVAGSPKPQTAEERLAGSVTVTFDRDTLEMALRYLSDEIDVPIVILGSDLQLEGITKNQSFGLDQRNKPGESVLLEILTRANPDKTATGPADPKQKLVYVLKPDDSGKPTIYVTTRASATKRGDALPAAFSP